MSTSESSNGFTRKDGTILTWLLLAVGTGLVGYGGYVHFTGGQRTLSHCGGCDPWHPLWVVTPLVLGSVFVLPAGILAVRR